MTDRIQNIIEDIRHKSVAMHQQLLEEREKARYSAKTGVIGSKSFSSQIRGSSAGQY